MSHRLEKISLFGSLSISIAGLFEHSSSLVNVPVPGSRRVFNLSIFKIQNSKIRRKQAIQTVKS